MIGTPDFREGLIYKDGGQTLEIITYQHHRKSQARAVVRVKVRDVNSGATLEKSYASNDKFQDVEVHKKDFQFLYAEGGTLHFMDVETYEQEVLDRAKLGDQARFLVENMDCIGVYFDGAFRTVTLPANVVLTVSSCEPGFKGDSVSNLQKNATTNTGIELKVPLFIKEGDSIRVDTRTGEYIERA
ncbi:MAG TPA: elongation factor P [Elusimicrobia bacterium]|nr:elongation factor P [Elusimicrobiota bacterium]